MKHFRLVLSFVLLAFAGTSFGQSDTNKTDVPKTAAQKSFDQMKTLAGSWEGPVTVQPPSPRTSVDKPIQVTLRVTSMGNLLVHEMKSAERPDNPITTIYLDSGNLQLTHYCDAGNRPRMVGKISPDGKTVEFDFADVAGGTEYGHMHHAVFTAIDADHHTEDWTYMEPGDKPMHAHMDLHRTKGIVVASE